MIIYHEKKNKKSTKNRKHRVLTTYCMEPSFGIHIIDDVT